MHRYTLNGNVLCSLIVILILIVKIKCINFNENSRHIEIIINFYSPRGTILWGKDISVEIDDYFFIVNEEGVYKQKIFNICEDQNLNCLFTRFQFTFILNNSYISIQSNNGKTYNVPMVNRHNWKELRVVKSDDSKYLDQFDGYVSNLIIDGISQKLPLIKESCENDTCNGGICQNRFPNKYICQCDYVVGNGQNCNKTLNSIQNNIQCETFDARYLKFSSKDSWPRIQFWNKDTLISIYKEEKKIIYATNRSIFKTKFILTKHFNQSGSNILELSYNISHKSLTIIYHHNGMRKTFIVLSPIEGYIGNNLTVGSSSNVGLALKTSSMDLTYQDFCKEIPKSKYEMVAKASKEYVKERNNGSIGQHAEVNDYKTPLIVVVTIMAIIMCILAIIMFVLCHRHSILKTKSAESNGYDLVAVITPPSPPIPENVPDKKMSNMVGNINEPSYKLARKESTHKSNYRTWPDWNNSAGSSRGQGTSALLESDDQNCSSTPESPILEIIENTDVGQVLPNTTDHIGNCA